jgi:6-phosphofructokinase 1
MRSIAVVTSGGDAPGMNAATRAVVRTALSRGWQAFGVRQGFAGLMAGDFIELGDRDVGGIVHLGGTILGSARAPEFKTDEGHACALRQLHDRGISDLVVIGGGGSQAGALALHRLGFSVVGVASTIDNDLLGTEVTIGVDTALNIALEAIDRLKITASSHHRAFLVEVMGRDCGYLALMAGIAGGAEAIALPEFPVDPETLAAEIRSAFERGKEHAIVVVAEGASSGALELVRYFEAHRQRLGYELRATILGHVQRGGAPSAFDRTLASRLGAAAVEAVERGEKGVLTGLLQGRIQTTPLDEVVGHKKSLDPRLFELSRILAR